MRFPCSVVGKTLCILGVAFEVCPLVELLTLPGKGFGVEKTLLELTCRLLQQVSLLMSLVYFCKSLASVHSPHTSEVSNSHICCVLNRLWARADTSAESCPVCCLTTNKRSNRREPCVCFCSPHSVVPAWSQLHCSPILSTIWVWGTEHSLLSAGHLFHGLGTVS